MYATMDQARVALDRKILQNLAIWEPRSFRVSEKVFVLVPLNFLVKKYLVFLFIK